MELSRHRIATLISIFIIFFLWIAVQAWMAPILFDDGYNYQVAISLAENFTYKTRYEPHHIYGGITTNGLIQYLLAGLLQFFDIDVSRTILLGSIGGLMAVSTCLLSRDSLVLWAVLLLVWPVAVYCSTSFLGEIFATSLILFGLYFWRKMLSNLSLEEEFDENSLRFIRKSSFLLAAIFFGLAIATKFLTLFVIPVVVFCITCDSLSRKTKHLSWNFVFRSILVVFVLTIFAFCFFCMQFFLSLFHSGVEWGIFLEKLYSFIFDLHLRQGVGSSSRPVTFEWLIFTGRNPMLLALIAFSLVQLVLRSPAYILLAFLYGIMLFYGQLNERRMLTISLLILLVAAGYYREFWMFYFQRHVMLVKHMNAPILFICSFLLITTYYSGRPIKAFSFEEFSIDGADPYFVFSPGRKSHSYTPQLLEKIQQLDGPIVTNGWWQLPEISIRSRRDFLDRMSVSNKGLIDNWTNIYFLFDESNSGWPPVSHSLCAEEVFRDRSLVLCRFNVRNRPLDFVENNVKRQNRL